MIAETLQKLCFTCLTGEEIAQMLDVPCEKSADALGNLHVTVGKGKPVLSFVTMCETPRLQAMFVENNHVYVEPLGKIKKSVLPHAELYLKDEKGVFAADEAADENTFSDGDRVVFERLPENITLGQTLSVSSPLTLTAEGIYQKLFIGRYAAVAVMTELIRKAHIMSKNAAFTFIASSAREGQCVSPAVYGDGSPVTIFIEPYAGEGVASLVSDGALVCDEQTAELLAQGEVKKAVLPRHTSAASKMQCASVGKNIGVLLLPVKNEGETTEAVTEQHCRTALDTLCRLLNTYGKSKPQK